MEAREEAAPAAAGADAQVPCALHINGSCRPSASTCTTLLDTLRERLGLNGTKKGPTTGSAAPARCWREGRRINSCLTLAVMHARESITTIEGLSAGDALHPLQQAFLEHDGALR